MPTDKDFKRVVRTRAARTGESYTAARAQLVRGGGRGARTASVRVAVSGAAGRVGYALAFRLASGDVFDAPVELRLLEVPEAMRRTEAIAMELEDCSSPALRGVHVTDDPRDAFAGASWLVLVAGAPRHAGIERADLLAANAGIFRGHGAAVAEAADASVRVLVVANPSNTNCLVAREAAPDVPRDRWFSLVRLDQSRARARLAARAGVAPASVTNLAIWGNHSATLFPDFLNARVDGVPAATAIGDRTWLEDDFVPWVRRRGAQLLEVGGASSAGSAADAVAGTIRDLTRPTPADDCVAVAVPSAGEYGVPEGLQFGFPVTVGRRGWRVRDGFELDEYCRRELRRTVDELLAERDAVRALDA